MEPRTVRVEAAGGKLMPKVLVAAIALACAQAYATPYFYKDAAGTNSWGTASNWALSNGNTATTVPGSNDNVTIAGTTKNLTVDYSNGSATSTINGFSMEGTFQDTLRILSGTLNVKGSFVAGERSTVDIAGGTLNLNGSPNTLGNLKLRSGTLGGTGAVSVSKLTTLSGGTLAAGGAITTNGGVNLEGNTTLNRSLSVASGTTFDVKGDFAVSGTGGSITNNGNFIKSAGTNISTIGTSFTNTGTVTSKSGTLAFSNGVQGGTLQTNGGSLSLGKDSTVQTIKVGTGTGTLNLGANKITVSGDYENENFGSGNSFNRHANVTGTINAAGAGTAPLSYQQLSTGNGSNKTAGNLTANYGIVGHVGDNAQGSFQISNASGTNGVTLRGAVKETTGSGSNWVANAGETVNKTVSFDTTKAGATSTQVTVVNNFDNTNNDQVLTANGIVNNYAVASFSAGAGSLTGNGNNYTFNLGNFTKGGTGIAYLALTNSGGSADYTDLLTGSFSAKSSLFTLGNASFSSLVGGDSNTLSLSFNTNTAGSTFSDQLTLTYYGFNASGYQEALKTVNFTVMGSVVSPVPEPETWGMLLVGLGVIGLRVRAMKDRSNKVHS